MKRFLGLALLVCGSACLQAQIVDTTVCDVLKAPASFDGKIVRIKGTVVAGFDQFIIKGSDCHTSVNAIWLAYPEKTRAKAGPSAVILLQPAHNFAGTVAAKVRTPVTLDKGNKDFKQFDNALSAQHNKGDAMCLGCERYEVSATMVGRLDGVADANLIRNAAGKITSLGGFGNMNSYSARLVLQAVADVTQKEIDYSKTDALSKGQTTTFGGTPDLFDPIAAAQKTVDAVNPGSPASVQAHNAVAAFGKRGDHIGVYAVFGSTTNEAPAKFDAQSTEDSPDGIIYNCGFNEDRLQGDPMSRAIVHTGQLVADLRNPMPTEDLPAIFDREEKAWTITAVVAMANRQSTLTLSGAHLVWSASWPVADRPKMLDDAVVDYLTTEQLFAR